MMTICFDVLRKTEGHFLKNCEKKMQPICVCRNKRFSVLQLFCRGVHYHNFHLLLTGHLHSCSYWWQSKNYCCYKHRLRLRSLNRGVAWSLYTIDHSCHSASLHCWFTHNTPWKTLSSFWLFWVTALLEDIKLDWKIPISLFGELSQPLGDCSTRL